MIERFDRSRSPECALFWGVEASSVQHSCHVTAGNLHGGCRAGADLRQGYAQYPVCPGVTPKQADRRCPLHACDRTRRARGSQSDDRGRGHRATLGAAGRRQGLRRGRAYRSAWSDRVTPHVAQHTSGRRSAIDGRTTRHPGYAISQRPRKRIEEPFGWIKATDGLRKPRHRSLPRVGWVVTLTAAACNLIRLSKILASAL